MVKIRQKSLLFSLTWPIFIELILQMLMGNIDQMMIAKYSDSAVAAVGNANQILNFLVLAFNVLCTASIILITQYKGAKQEDKVETIYSLSLIVNIIVSGVISLIIFLFNGVFFDMMSVPVEVLSEAKTYIVLTGSFIFLQALSMTYAALLRSNRYMKESMTASVVMNLLNIVGNVVLINGMGPIPALGVAGVAISTTLSRLVGVIIMMYMFKKYVGVKISLKKLKPFPKDLFKKLLGIGLPSAGENFAYSLSQVVIMGFINLFGTVTITVKVYVSMLAMVTYILTSALAQATQVMIGHMLGARQIEETDRRVWATLRISMLSSLIASGVILLFSDFFFGLFSGNPEVLKMGKTVMFIDLFLEQGRAINICFVRCLQAAGDIKFPVMLGVISAWLVAVLFSYIFGVVFSWGLAGVWIAQAMDELIRGVCFIIRWRKGGWKSKDLVNA